MKCAEHPRYAVKRMPVKTMKYPDGCPTCLRIWEERKYDDKRLLKTVNLELSLEDARLVALTLETSMVHLASGATARKTLANSLRQFKMSEGMRSTLESSLGQFRFDEASMKTLHAFQMILVKAIREAQ